jgi:predicted DCC family thiol-disulfide oxidoreductase YuxK
MLFGGFYKNHFYLLVLAISFIAMMACDRRYCVLPRGKGTAPGWPLILMRVQVSVVYGYAGIAKVNPEFLSGDVLGYYFERALMPMELPVASLVTVAIATVALEVFIAGAVWLGRLRPVAFGLVLPLHFGMLFVAGDALQFFEIVLFAAIMTTLLTAFLHLPERGRLVVWDDSCTFCRRWVALFRRADAFGALRFAGASDPAGYAGTGVTPEALTTAMHLVEPDGTVRSGFDAVRGIVAVLPFGFLVAPWMALPGARHLGTWGYRRVALRRTCAYLPARPHV